jgi:hypothetical protein
MKVYVLNFMGMTKYLTVKNHCWQKIQYLQLMKRTTMRFSIKMLTFFNSGYKYSMDILQGRKRVEKIQYIKLFTMQKIKEKKSLLGLMYKPNTSII